jgi:hypothetical protein
MSREELQIKCLMAGNAQWKEASAKAASLFCILRTQTAMHDV